MSQAESPRSLHLPRHQFSVTPWQGLKNLVGRVPRSFAGAPLRAVFLRASGAERNERAIAIGDAPSDIRGQPMKHPEGAPELEPEV
jgi:hypothetical protein